MACPAILFLHGFPDLWYSWRHQLFYFSVLGFRAIATDLRGYGDSDSPAGPFSYTFFHIVGDLIGLLDHFAIDRVFLVGHDWGAVIAWAFALFRPDRIKALVALSVPFSPIDPAKDSAESLKDLFGCRFQDCEEMGKKFASKDFFSIHEPRPPFIPKATGI